MYDYFGTEILLVAAFVGLFMLAMGLRRYGRRTDFNRKTSSY